MNPAITDTLPYFIPSPGAMLFSSAEYLLVFLPLTVIVYYLLNHRACVLAGKLWLTAASLFFYACWSLSYLWLICGSILFNYGAARWLGHLDNIKARTVLYTAITCNILLLGYYKYLDFFIGNLNLFLDAPFPLIQIALPLGISFFTIQQIAYLVDVYEDTVKEKSFINYSLFVTFFPHLLAGPILHHREMMPQFASKDTLHINWQNIYFGLFIIGIGLIKKVIFAESLSLASNDGFNSTTPLLFHNAWICSLSYSTQIYFDFSGYTDMAIGAALLFNIHLPENFNSPFKAKNLPDYWKRWHMTLTRFITTYIYTPFLRSTPGGITFTKSMVATMIAMFVAGIWHGASWNYVLFGVMHGTGLVISHSWRHFNFRMPGWLAWIMTFLFVNTALVIFRAENLATAMGVLKGMLGLQGFAPISDITTLLSGITQADTWNPLGSDFSPARQLLVLLACLFIALRLPNTAQLMKSDIVTQPRLLSMILLSITTGTAIFYSLFMTSSIASFLYFFF